jgi:hypothetical protein
VVLPVSEFLPRWLKSMPAFVERKRRKYWWSFRSMPVNGWYVQQFAKIAVANAMPETQACMLDSDVAFFRHFDESSPLGQSLSRRFISGPMKLRPARRYTPWVRSSHRLFGLDPPSFPADDFIGHVIYWNRTSVRAMVARIEAVTGLELVEALCRARSISEYMLYGYFVRSDADAMRRHRLTMETPCLSYWEDEPLDEAATERMLNAAVADRPAFSVQSISGTPVARIRAVLHRLPSDAAGDPTAPLAPQIDPGTGRHGAARRAAVRRQARSVRFSAI